MECFWPDDPGSKPEYAIVGIGIYAYEPEGGFPPDIAKTAGCVFDSTEVGLKNRLAAAVLDRFMEAYRSL